MRVFIDKRKIALCTVYDPVRHGVGGKINAVTLVRSGLSFQRKGIRIFTVDDGCDQRRGGDTVAKQIYRMFSPDDGAVSQYYSRTRITPIFERELMVLHN